MSNKVPIAQDPYPLRRVYIEVKQLKGLVEYLDGNIMLSLESIPTVMKHGLQERFMKEAGLSLKHWNVDFSFMATTYKSIMEGIKAASKTLNKRKKKNKKACPMEQLIFQLEKDEHMRLHKVIADDMAKLGPQIDALNTHLKWWHDKCALIKTMVLADRSREVIELEMKLEDAASSSSSPPPSLSAFPLPPSSS